MTNILEKITEEIEQETVRKIIDEIEVIVVNNDTRITYVFIKQIAKVFLPTEVCAEILKRYNYLNKSKLTN